MMNALLMRTPTGFIAADNATREWFSRIKIGALIHADTHQMRNSAFFRKWWALAEMAYSYWGESVQPIEYRGEPVMPQFERFRKDLTISAGFYHPVVNLRGELRIEPDSLKWSSMTEETFNELYNGTINVLLKRVFNGRVCPQWSEHELRQIAEQILEFS